MRRNFVSTDSPFPSTDGVSSCRAIMCGLLPSSGITRLHRYYEAIRLPTLHLPFSLFGCSGILPLREETWGLPGCRIITISDMPWSLTPRKQTSPCLLRRVCVDFHCLQSVVLPNATITRLNPFNLTAYGLSARCPTLKAGCYHPASKDSLPGGWPTFRGGIPTRLITRPCLAAL